MVLLRRYESYEKNLLQALYGYIRAGRIEDAEEVGRRAHRPWRAASIRGCKLFKWNALCKLHFHVDTTPLTQSITLAAENNDEESNNDEVNEPEALDGNRHRRLWESTCMHAALSASHTLPRTTYMHSNIISTSSNPPYLTKNVYSTRLWYPHRKQTAFSDPPATWENHLWADTSVIAEEKSSNELAKLAAGSFWEGGVEAVEKGPDELRNLQADDDEEWEEGVLKALESLSSVVVAEGCVPCWW